MRFFCLISVFNYLLVMECCLFMVERLDDFKEDKKQVVDDSGDSKVRRIMNPNEQVRRIVNEILGR